jgi:murein DD-endopeptidase MepM/ murein hydrolase activator NlpD
VVRLLCLLALAALTAAAVATAGSPARARAQATLATGSLGTFGALSASGDEQADDTFSIDARGLRVGTALTEVRAQRSAAAPTAYAEATARSVRLLDGLVTAYGAVRRAEAAGGKPTFSGRVTGLRIGERLVEEVRVERAYPLPDDAGSVVVNRGSAALTLTLTKPVNGFPAGTTVSVADVAATARAAVADEPEATPEPTATEEPTKDARAEKRSERKRKRAERRRQDAAAIERLSGERFVFPVFGTGVTTADDYGAPRAITVHHEGNDIFGPFGAPVLAVADGTVEKVGTLPISGNRLWLRTAGGDTFFYAHLSAFAPAAVTGQKVRAGQLLGFVGNTGDAEPTPPHVHFEIHPGDKRAVDPHAVLEAWRRADVPAGAWVARYGGEPAPGSLVEVEDFIDG